jgi:hypothetical protein
MPEKLSTPKPTQTPFDTRGLQAHDGTERKTKKTRLRNAEAQLRQQTNQAARRATKATDDQIDLGA